MEGHERSSLVVYNGATQQASPSASISNHFHNAVKEAITRDESACSA